MRIRGLTWAEGTLWVGQYRDRKIYQIDPETVAILRTIEFNRFVTEVTWVEEELSPPPHQNIADSRTIKDYSKANSEPDPFARLGAFAAAQSLSIYFVCPWLLDIM